MRPVSIPAEWTNFRIAHRMAAMAEKHYFLSDLHLFSKRSLATQHHGAIEAAAREAKTFILGGDIFDFRWTTLASMDATLDASIKWLADLVAINPACTFHFVFGNHDYNSRFLDAIDQLAHQTPNLLWHRCYLRLGSSLFLHGDVADKPRTSTQSLLLRRKKWMHDEPAKGRAANFLYDMVINARLHKLAKLVHRDKRVAMRLVHYLETVGHGPASGLRDVYFGHTHCAMSDFSYGGLTFHNGGAPMKGLEFRIVEAKVDGEGTHSA